MKYIAEKLPFKIRCNNCDGMWASVQVIFGTICPNNCKFCIAQQKNGANGNCVADWNQMPEQEKILKSLKVVLAENPIDEVMITGGDPFQLINILHPFVLECKKLVKCVKIVSSLPQTVYDNFDLAREIINDIDQLVISVQAPTLEGWNQVLQSNQKHDRFDLIKRLVEKFPTKIKTNSVFSSDIYHNKNDIDNLIQKLIDCGIKDISLNEVRGDPSHYVDASNLMELDINSPFSHGCRIPIKIQGHEDIKCVFGKACFLTETSQYANFADLMKTIVRSKYLPIRRIFLVPKLKRAFNIKPDGSMNVIDLR